MVRREADLRRSAVVVLAVLALVALVTGHALVWLVVAVVLAASTRKRHLGRLQDLPGGFVVVTGAVLLAGLMAGGAGIDLYGDVAGTRTVLALISTSLAIIAWRRPAEAEPQGLLPTRTRLGSLVWALPALLTALMGLAPAIGPASSYGWVFAGDHLRLMLMAAQQFEDGGLTYAVNPYPRARW